MSRFQCGLLAAVLLIVPPAFSQNLEDIEKMKAEHAKRTDNILVLACARGGCRAEDVPIGLKGPEDLLISNIGFYLAELRFLNSIPLSENQEFVAAVAAFQKSLGSKATGKLLVREWKELHNRQEFVKRKELIDAIPYRTFRFDTEPTYLLAEGSWQQGESVEDTTANSVELWCEKSTMTCRETRLDLLLGLRVSVDSWPIRTWGGDEIVAEDNSARCVNRSLVLSPALQRVVTIRRGKTAGSTCELTDQRVLVWTLVDGFKFHAEKSQAWWKKAQAYYNPAYAKSILGVIDRDAAEERKEKKGPK